MNKKMLLMILAIISVTSLVATTQATKIDICNDNEYPEIEVDYPTEVKLGKEYDFNVTGNDPEGDKIHYIFSFLGRLRNGWDVVHTEKHWYESGEKVTVQYSWPMLTSDELKLMVEYYDEAHEGQQPLHYVKYEIDKGGLSKVRLRNIFFNNLIFKILESHLIF